MHITCPNCRQQIEDTEAKCPFCDGIDRGKLLPLVHDDGRGMISGTYNLIRSADTSEPCPYCNGRTL